MGGGGAGGLLQREAAAQPFENFLQPGFGFRRDVGEVPCRAGAYVAGAAAGTLAAFASADVPEAEVGVQGALKFLVRCRLRRALLRLALGVFGGRDWWRRGLA